MSRKLRFSLFALCLVAVVSAGCKSLNGCSSCGAKAEPVTPAATAVVKADAAVQRASFTAPADDCKA